MYGGIDTISFSKTVNRLFFDEAASTKNYRCASIYSMKTQLLKGFFAFWKVLTVVMILKLQTLFFYGISFHEIEFVAFRPWRIESVPYNTERECLCLPIPLGLACAFCKITQGKRSFTTLKKIPFDFQPGDFKGARILHSKGYEQSFLILAVNAKVTNLHRALRKSIFCGEKNVWKERSTLLDIICHKTQNKGHLFLLRSCCVRRLARQNHTSISYGQLSANNAYMLYLLCGTYKQNLFVLVKLDCGLSGMDKMTPFDNRKLLGSMHENLHPLPRKVYLSSSKVCVTRPQ